MVITSAAMITLGAPLLKKAVGATLGKVAQKALEVASASAQKKIQAWTTSGSISKVSKKLDQVRMVKTIWQVDKPVDLFDFYCTSHLMADNRKVAVNYISDIPSERNVVIQGTVGQGKSSFLRYLAVREAVETNRLALFVELRKLQEQQTLEELIIEEINSLGLASDHEVFESLASSSSLILLMDAFDEVKESRQSRLIHELESLGRRYAELRMIVSSRPFSGVERLPLWDVYSMALLDGTDRPHVIRRICHDEATSEAIIGGLKGHYIGQVLTTPLMIALLIIRYRAEQSIPENEVAFYSDLFMLLLQRHDKTKAGYVRERKSKLGDLALKKVFVTTCFLSRKLGTSNLKLDEMYDIAKQGMETNRIEADPELVLDDIKSITCLLLEEGGEFRFIHKSVQEYHASCFVERLNEESAKLFYSAMLGKYSAWEQELRFLEVIDRYRCLKFFIIPKMRSVLEMPNLIRDILEHAVLMVPSTRNLREDKRGHKFSALTFKAHVPDVLWLIRRISAHKFDLFKFYVTRSELESLSGFGMALTARQLADSGVGTDRFNAVAREVVEFSRAHLESLEREVANFEAQRQMVEF